MTIWMPLWMPLALAVAAGLAAERPATRAETFEERHAAAVRAFRSSDWYQRNLAYAPRPFHWDWTEVPNAPWLLQYQAHFDPNRGGIAPEVGRRVLVVDRESGAPDERLAAAVAAALDRLRLAGPRCTFSPSSDGAVLVCPPTSDQPLPPLVRFRWDGQAGALRVAAEDQRAPLEVKHERALRAFRRSEPYAAFHAGGPLAIETVVEVPGGRWLLDLVRLETAAQAIFVVDPSTGRLATEETRALSARVEKAAAPCGDLASGSVSLDDAPAHDARTVDLILVGDGASLPTCFIRIDAALRVSSRFGYGRATPPSEEEAAAHERERQRRLAAVAAGVEEEDAKAVSLLKSGKQGEAIAAWEALADRCLTVLRSPDGASRGVYLAAFNNLGYAYWLRKDQVRSAAYLFECERHLRGTRPVLLLNIADWYHDAGDRNLERYYLQRFLDSGATAHQKETAQERLRQLGAP